MPPLVTSDVGIHTLNQTLQKNGNQGDLGIGPLPDSMVPFRICTALIGPICDKVPDSLQVLAIAGPKCRALVEYKITIMSWNYLMIDIWSSWHSLIFGMKSA